MDSSRPCRADSEVRVEVSMYVEVPSVRGVSERRREMHVETLHLFVAGGDEGNWQSRLASNGSDQ